MSARGPAPSSLRILHVLADLSAEAGGLPVSVTGLASALAARGHRVSIATTHASKPAPETVWIDPALEVHSFSCRWPRYRRSPGLARWLRVAIETFDIVHLHGLWQFPTHSASCAAAIKKIPTLVSPHGMLDRYSIAQRSAGLKWCYWHWRERPIHARAAAIHCLNRAEVDCLMPWARFFPKVILPNGISSAMFGALPGTGIFRAARPDLGDRPIVLFLSRLHPKKGLDRLIPHWGRLVRRFPEARFLIAGSGEPAYAAAIDRLIARHGFAGQIVRIGHLNGGQKWQALVDADCFVLPSRQEGFSVAILEALAAGCPAVVTRSCHAEDLEGCGRVIEDDDMPAFVDAVCEVLHDRDRRAQYAEAGRRLVRQRYSWESIAGDMEQAYRWAISGRPFSPDGNRPWLLPEAAR